LKLFILPDVLAANILSSSSFIINGSNKHDVTRIALTMSCNSFIVVIQSAFSLVSGNRITAVAEDNFVYSAIT